jgi:hypothetical protein
MTKEELTDKIKSEMISFAKKNDIDSIHRTTHEDNSGTIYCFVKSKYRYDSAFEDKLCALDITLFPNSGTLIMCSPVAPPNSLEIIYKKTS